MSEAKDLVYVDAKAFERVLDWIPKEGIKYIAITKENLTRNFCFPHEFAALNKMGAINYEAPSDVKKEEIFNLILEPISYEVKKSWQIETKEDLELAKQAQKKTV